MGAARFWRFLAQRLVKMAAMIVAIAVANFLLIHAAPGDPARVIAGKRGRRMKSSWRNCASNSAWISRCRRSCWIYHRHLRARGPGIRIASGRRLPG